MVPARKESVFFRDAVPAGLTMLQWTAPHPCRDVQHKLDSEDNEKRERTRTQSWEADVRRERLRSVGGWKRT